MSTIMSIAIDPPILLKPSMRIGEVLPKLSELKIRAAPVVNDDGVLIGILSYKTVLTKGVGRDTKVSTVMDPPYAIESSESIDRTIALMVSWKARDVSIVDRIGKVVGYISRAIILKYLLDHHLIPNENVENIMSSPAVVIHEQESIARARWLMLKNAFSRLPVVNEFNRIVGVITLSDIVERLYRIKLSRRKGYEWVESEESFLAASVSDFMSSPPITTHVGSSIVSALELMLSKGVSGLPVVTEDGHVVGVLSGIDILRRYVEKFAVIHPVEASISKVIGEDEVTKAHVERIVNSYLASFSRYLNVIDFKLSIKELKKSGEVVSKDVRRGFQVSTKIVTDVGSFTAKTVCWDLPTCVREALSILERRIRKQIEKRTIFRSSYRRSE